MGKNKDKSSGAITNISTIISILLVVMVAIKKGYIGSEIAGLVLVFGIIVLIAMRHVGVARIFLLFMSFVYFLVEFDMYSVSGAMKAIMSLSLIVIVIYGFVLVISGPFSKK